MTYKSIRNLTTEILSNKNKCLMILIFQGDTTTVNYRYQDYVYKILNRLDKS